MKYMGSKRAMLNNGLGKLLLTEAKKHRRVVDLFCGSASVAWFAAQNTGLPVFATDLQSYSVALASSVLQRVAPADCVTIDEDWLGPIGVKRSGMRAWRDGGLLDRAHRDIAALVDESRKMCMQHIVGYPIWNSYGGHYFSPTQAITFDLMLRALPEREPLRSLCLGSVITAASDCAAGPGHTAQPFQATVTSARFIKEAWMRDPIFYTRKALRSLAGRHSTVVGESHVADAVEVAGNLDKADLVFVDPPYSGVHYSRFYHVLETMARGRCGRVSGAGRYPPLAERPASAFSKSGESAAALAKLLANLAGSGCTVIFTFPAARCSNGLSGEIVRRMARQHFQVAAQTVKGEFSTLGGNNLHRSARIKSRELVLLLRPR